MTEQERQREADRQREERQRNEDSRRQEEERRRQEQRQQDERRRKESQGREISQRQEAQRGAVQEDIHEATARTLQDKGRKDSEKRTIETAQKRGVPIALANLSMSGRSQSESRPPQEPEKGKPDSPAVERLKVKMEKVKEQSKAQDKIKSHGVEHDRG